MGALSSRLAASPLAHSKFRTTTVAESTLKKLSRLLIEYMLLVDATGSMAWCIEVVKRHLSALLHRLAEDENHDLTFCCGFYRDHDCDVPFRFFGRGSPTEGEFVGRERLSELDAFLEREGYTEGNSTPVEALGAALHHVTRLPWKAPKRVLVHVGDHASHGFNPALAQAPEWAFDSIELCPLRMTHEKILARLRSARIRCYMVRCGDDADAERQYRAIAEATGGAFIDFQSLGSPEDLLIVQELALTHASGVSVRKLLERKASSGALKPPAVRALLDAFGE